LSAGAATSTASTDQLPLSGIKESLLDRSATNANQGFFAACASMIKNDGRQYSESERDNVSSEKNK
jgi:hypothetical protein